MIREIIAKTCFFAFAYTIFLTNIYSHLQVSWNIGSGLPENFEHELLCDVKSNIESDTRLLVKNNNCYSHLVIVLGYSCYYLSYATLKNNCWYHPTWQFRGTQRNVLSISVLFVFSPGCHIERKQRNNFSF